MGEAQKSSGEREQLLRFCQLDFPFPLGPVDGRYLRRGRDGDEVAVIAIQALHAERRSRLRRRRPAGAEPGATAPDPVAITRATVATAAPFEDAAAAARWLGDCRSREVAEAEVEAALGLVNAVVSAHRVAAHDPYARDLTAADVQRARLGFGTGDQIVEGTWQEAMTVPAARAGRRTRRKMLSPEEETAGILSGRRPSAMPSEELVIRARLDLDHGRAAEGALMARAAADALAAEGRGGEEGVATRLAQAALAGALSAQDVEELDELVRRLERITRRRRYAAES